MTTEEVIAWLKGELEEYEKEFNEIWFDYFDFGRDYDVLKADFGANEMLREACEFAPGIRVLHQEPWEAFITFIISQNNNIARIKGIVERYYKIELKYLDEKFNEQIKVLSGFSARVVQHECDHLDGIVFLDKVINKGFATRKNIQKYNLKDNLI